MPEELSPKGRIGPQLKLRRQAMRLSLAQVEIDTKIRGRFLTALESGNYDTLPNDIYSRGFVQHYAAYLGLEATSIAAAYAAERGGIEQAATNRPKLDRQRRFVVTAPLVATLLGVAVLIGIVTYLVWQFSALAAPPNLAVTSPETDETITGSIIDVAGKTTPGSDVTVNDSAVLTATDGSFDEKVALQDGVNSIRIKSTSKLGKTTVLTRNILARLTKIDPAAAAVPTAPFAGVAVAVMVKETTSVVVVVDGKEAFRGTFIAGHSQLFTGTTDINLTTGNAGATAVTVTNSVAANKKIDPLGKEGEIRRNQDFAITTVIP